MNLLSKRARQLQISATPQQLRMDRLTDALRAILKEEKVVIHLICAFIEGLSWSSFGIQKTEWIHRLNMLLISASSNYRSLADRNDDPIFAQIDELIAENYRLCLDVEKLDNSLNAMKSAFTKALNGDHFSFYYVWVFQIEPYEKIIGEVYGAFGVPLDTRAPDIDRVSKAKLQVFQLIIVGLLSSIRRHYISTSSFFLIKC